ncbi:YggT family protein [Candidatus Poriferisodalis multihospitum]|jgi:YggT family protein|uniref:YggT family protein n=1 Tax=Candidatus Poriferisodalis TaxID=2983190 RepID=UPI00138617A0|nr:YggT family protein [Candidatus Poriferisodalis multihospitum]MCY3584190.1 YggT family protein [Acidimicrobiaceae bacterium]MXV87935.1 YggT family protein [Acidimicrobiales bacterium]MCY3608573.1 YggT family protein [Acidimicrobiaceae bacterium]MCY3893055.1 YggT family protein [Acidimicrobiaceae bacterium]MCY3949174.1 YggT family protein [Acidimicrobiaceae bacterium]
MLCTLISLYVFAIFARVLFSWIPLAPESPVMVVRTWLVRITEPVMGPLRRALPAVRLGRVALDLSPIVLIIGLQVFVAGMLLGC